MDGDTGFYTASEDGGDGAGRAGTPKRKFGWHVPEPRERRVLATGNLCCQRSDATSPLQQQSELSDEGGELR